VYGYRPDLAADPALDRLPPAQVEAYVRAWEQADVQTLIDLLREDAVFSMPPIPSWYGGQAAIRTLVARTIFAGEAQGRWRLIAARANRQAAFGLYRAGGDGLHHAYGVQIVTRRGDAIAEIVTFRVPDLCSRFGLPITLPS
jgi:RNA polymerase sigma-70 factor (ECF subfamily)